MDVFTLSAKLILNTSDFNTSLQNSEKKMSAWGVTLGTLASQAITKGVRAITDFGKSTVETGADFEAMMSEVKALRQDATAEEFDKLSQKAQELGASTKFTATEVASAFKYMALAGWDTDEMLAGIDGVLALSAASGEDLAQTSDIVTDALTALGLTADDTNHFVDVLAAAAANSNTTVGMMGEAFKYLATTGGVLGYSIDDVATVLGLLANNGIKASQAGTSMRQILNSLVAPSDAAAEAMSDLGISLFEEGTDKAKPLLQVLQEMRSVFQNSNFDLGGKSMDEVQSQLAEVDAWYDEWKKKLEEGGGAADYLGKTIDSEELEKMYNEKLQEITNFNEQFLGQLSSIGGLRGISSLLAIMKSTDEDFNQLVTSVENSNGAAQSMAGTMLDNLKGDVTILNSAIDGLKILVSEDFTSQFRGFVKTLTDGVGAISKGFQEGGLAGMFTNLANWVIDGITGALSDDSITGEGANNFGKALGDFVGNLVAKLVSNAPELISGLFEAGVNLAGGLIEGLFSGLFGTGSGTVPGMINNAKEQERDAVAAADQAATKATGILGYMDSLRDKYGESAEKTKEWSEALESLKSVFPEINGFIATEGGELSATNEQLLAYIDNSRKAAIEDAKRKTVQGLTEKYTQAQYNLEETKVKADLAQQQRDEAMKEIIEFIQQFEPDFKGENLSIDQLEHVAYDYASGNKEAQDQVKNLVKVYKDQDKAMNDFNKKIPDLESALSLLQSEVEIAEKALKNMADEANSFKAPDYTAYGEWANDYYSQHSHASGAWNIPYDNYPAMLHRGEMVLTSSQARRYRDGEGGGMNLSALTSAVVNAVREGMSGAVVRSYLNGKDVTDDVARRMGNAMKSQRYAT